MGVGADMMGSWRLTAIMYSNSLNATTNVMACKHQSWGFRDPAFFGEQTWETAS